jgi:hypothetical protein
MKNFQENIDKLVSKILNEEIESRVKHISETKGQWEEIEMDEELSGNQSKIDVAKPKGKITAADFKKLRKDRTEQIVIDDVLGGKTTDKEKNFKNLRKDRTEEKDMVVIDVLGGKTKDEKKNFKNLRKDRNEQVEIDVLGGKTKNKEIEEYYVDEDTEPKGKITAADFKKLRDAKAHKKEVEEYYYSDEDIEDAEQLSQDEPTYVGKGLADNKIKNKIANKMFGSFDDEHGWFDQSDREHSGDFDFDYDEEEFEDFPSLMTKHGKNQRWFGPNDGEKFFNKYQQHFGGKPFRVRIAKGLEEAETEEGNAFTGALAKAKASGKDSFEVDGKEYNVNESEDKWIQKTNMKKGALHKALGIPEGQKIPKSKLNSIKKDLMSKAKGDKKLSAADSKLLKQVNMALTLGGIKESKDSLSLTENELIDMIESIVKEQMVKDPSEKNNFGIHKPQGLKKTEKAQGESKKENDDYAKEVVKKMKDYMKDMYMGGGSYNENPDDFPQSNYDMEKEHNEMKYHPSDAVEEYIEAFSYPGMTNLVYDEIKPDDEMIAKQIKGDAKNGNAVTGKDGKALGNVSKRSTKVGDRFKKNFDENLYGAEQMNVSYKRQPQPVDVAGSKKQNGSLKSIKSGSTNKAQKIMNQLESTEDKATKIIKEDLQKMKDLISYNRKTQ